MKISLILLMTILLNSCGSKTKVEAVKVTQGFVESTVTTINSGTVEAKKQAELAFGSVGRISNIKVSLGDIVKEGTIIAEIENADLKALFDETNKEYERSVELFKSGLVSISNLDSAKRAKEVARINLEKTIIKAPFNGMITSLDLKIGELYQNTTVVNQKPKVQIIDLEKRLVKGEIDEVDLNKVKVNQSAKIKIPALKNTYLKAIVKKVVPFVSTAKDQDRTSQIELELIMDKDQEIKTIPVGASADVEIVTEKKENAMIIPSNYMQGVGNNKFVYKIVNNKMVKTNITLGTGNYERYEVISGLSINDIIARPPEGVDDPTNIKIEVEIKKWP